MNEPHDDWAESLRGLEEAMGIEETGWLKFEPGGGAADELVKETSRAASVVTYDPLRAGVTNCAYPTADFSTTDHVTAAQSRLVSNPEDCSDVGDYLMRTETSQNRMGHTDETYQAGMTETGLGSGQTSRVVRLSL